MEQSHPKQEALGNSRLALGNEIDYFPIRFQLLNRWLVVTLGIILLLDAILSGLISTFNLWHAIQSHGRAILLVKITEPIIAIFLILPIGIMLIFLASLNWQNGLTLYEKGLIIRRQNREQAMFWDSIERFDNQITLVKFSGTTITARRRIIMESDHLPPLMIRNQYDRMDELISQLRAFILPNLFTHMRQELLQGGEIRFHSDVIAEKEGLWIKESLFPWNVLQSKADKKGKTLLIHRVDQQVLFKSQTNQIINLDVLLHLLENPPIPSI